MFSYKLCPADWTTLSATVHWCLHTASVKITRGVFLLRPDAPQNCWAQLRLLQVFFFLDRCKQSTVNMHHLVQPLKLADSGTHRWQVKIQSLAFEKNVYLQCSTAHQEWQRSLLIRKRKLLSPWKGLKTQIQSLAKWHKYNRKWSGRALSEQPLNGN